MNLHATHAVNLPDGRTIYVTFFSERDVAIPEWEGAAPGWRWCPEGVPFGTDPNQKWRGPFPSFASAVANAKRKETRP